MSSSLFLKNMPFLVKSLCFLLFIICDFNAINAQLAAFSSAPIYSLTFDSAPTSASPGYEYQPGRWPNSGLAYFNGASHTIALASQVDTLGRSFPLVGGAFSIEFWVSFETWASNSHIMDVSNNNDAQNVFIGNLNTGNGIRFGAIVKLPDGTQQERLIDRNGVLSSGVFTHVVCTMSLISTTDTTSNAASLISLYVNGALVGNNTQYVMPTVARSIQYLGRSTWSSDGLFNGWIDSFNYYNYPLSDQAVYAHSMLKRAPSFELTFGQNPLVIAGASATFAYVLSDPADIAANVSQWHQGVVTLDGTSQYINLSTSTGSSTVGTSLPLIGGAGYGTGTNYYDQGWTFEVAFRLPTINSNSKIFDLSNNGDDRIDLGFQTDTSLYFNVKRGSTSSTATSIISSVSTNTWYHIVIAVIPTNLAAGTAQFRVYVNGVSVLNATGAYPNAVARPTSYVGRSYTSTDAYCALTFDVLRIHDYALTPALARTLYYSVSSPVPVNPIPPPSIPTTAPRNVFNFDAQQQQTGYSSYTYLSDTNDGHFGVAAFNGVNSSVNLLYYLDANGQYFSSVIGGEMTFSCWAKWLDVPSHSRILDFGGALGIGDNNIILANNGASTELYFRIYSGSSSTSVYATRGIRPGNWQHVVAVVQRNTTNMTDSTSVYSAILSLYLDGKLISSASGYLPPRVIRENLLVARSNWVSDARFRGYIDSLQFYEYALDSQQIAAFACTTRPPVFDFGFTRDPRTLDPSVTYNYGWVNSDPEVLPPNSVLNPSNESVTFTHQGILSFNGSNQYVNLTAKSGPTNIGIQLPVIGGPGSGVGQYVGWTFEISFKLNAFANWAKLFDWGVNANGDDDILFGLVSDTHQMGFEILNSRVARSNRVIVIDNAVLNRWYHVVIVVTPISTVNGTAIWVPYLDSEALQPLTSGAVWPDAIMRKNANIGKSNWNDAYFNGFVDSIRVYDYALNENDVRCLYRASRSAPEVVPPVPLFNPGPRTSYSFEAGFDDAQSAVANFRWVPQLDGRNGVASFDTTSSYINMLGYTDQRQRSFPNVMGGTDLTFAAWVRFNAFPSYSRIFDIGNGAGVQNIALMNIGTTTNPGFHIYSNYGSTAFNPSINYPLNRWFHIVTTITRNISVAVNTSNAAVYRIYFNGTQMAETNGYYTSNAERLFAYLGRSGWSSDARLNGSIDSWAWWDYSLPLESIQTLALLARPPYFEMTFAADPRSSNISSNFLYNWLNRDSADPATSVHQGILDLDGPLNYYVDLMQTRGNRSLGINMPPIGGLSSGSLTDGSYGWSFEVVFKFDNSTNYCKILDIGNGANPSGIVGDDNVIFGLVGTTRQFRFEMLNSRTAQQSLLQLIPNITFGQWYSTIVVVEPTDLANFKARYTAYLNGVVVGTLTNAAYFQGIYRENAFMGKSEWSADALCDAKVDLLRIYDYALSPTEASMLVSRTMDPIVIASSSTGASGPITVSSSSTIVPPSASSSRSLTVTPVASSTLGTSSTPGTISSAGTSSTLGIISSTGTATPSLSCNYNQVIPEGSILTSLIFRNKPANTFREDFGMHFEAAIKQLVLSNALVPVVGCQSVISGTGVIYNADPLGNDDTKVQFYLLNVDNQAETMFTNLQQAMQTPGTAQNAFNTHLGNDYIVDPQSLERVPTDDSSGGLSDGAIAGIVIGSVIGGLLLLLLLVCLIRSRDKSVSSNAYHPTKRGERYEDNTTDGTEREVEMHRV